MGRKMNKDQFKVLLGIASLFMFLWAIVCLCTDFEASKGVGLMIGVLVLQNWKRSIPQ